MMNRYLRDRMIGRDRAHRDYRGRDGRNAYGSRGGYIRDSRRGDYRNSDYRREDYMDRDYRDYRDEPRERTPEWTDRFKRTAFEYGDFTDMDYAEMDEEYKSELEEWCRELKKQVRNPLPKSEVINKAEQMGVHFDKYDEKEFYTTVMMLMSDYPHIGQPETYIAMAKQWLEDNDAELTGSEKLSAYYYTIIKGE